MTNKGINKKKINIKTASVVVRRGMPNNQKAEMRCKIRGCSTILLTALQLLCDLHIFRVQSCPCVKFSLREKLQSLNHSHSHFSCTYSYSDGFMRSVFALWRTSWSSVTIVSKSTGR